ncbi:TRAFAC clade GTPase domain-containing protein, partial [Pseudomonas coronafaciens]|uniref:TRAFAC clade GTPase domain-containing protein n=1 Tax=Pseudomonas coronafaciens TaxID=53409 RepID=UPI000F3BD0C4
RKQHTRRQTPHISRTPFGEVNFYHLEVQVPQMDRCLTLLIGDRAGEEYRAATDDASVVSEFFEITRADVITVLVDGKRLLDSAARHNLRSDVTMMLQGILEGEAFNSVSRLAVVLTKLDAVKGHGQEDRALRDFNSLIDRLRDEFRGVFPEIVAFMIAASPEDTATIRGTGVSDLLEYWCRPAIYAVAHVPPFVRAERAFARLHMLVEPEEGNL